MANPSKHQHRHLVLLILIGAVAAPAETTTNVSLNLNLSPSSLRYSLSNSLTYTQTGSVDPLGRATLTLNNNQPIAGNAPAAPVQLIGGIYFNEVDSFSFTSVDNDLNSLDAGNFTLSPAEITGGTGKYAGATGSLSVTFTKPADGPPTSTGSGTVTVGGTTTAFTVNLAGNGGPTGTWQRDVMSGSLSGTVSPWGNASATLRRYYSYRNAPYLITETLTVSLNNSDSFNVYYSLPPGGSVNVPVLTSFKGIVCGGTGAFANAAGSFAMSYDNGTYRGTGTMTTARQGAPSISQVRTAYGLPQVATNTWIEVHGTNLVPPDTPSAGFDWGNAPEFADGRMPTQLGPISVSINNAPAYIYWYCSAATNKNCADDQINVLAPLLPTSYDGLTQVVVTNNGVSSAPFEVFMNALSPAFLSFDAAGHVVAQHSDYSLLGPATLYPGLSTPAKPGETVVLYAIGLGWTTTPINAGSSTQSSSLPYQPECWVGGIQVSVTGTALISPGLFQVNITMSQKKNSKSGDNPLVCRITGQFTAPGALIAVQ